VDGADPVRHDPDCSSRLPGLPPSHPPREAPYADRLHAAGLAISPAWDAPSGSLARGCFPLEGPDYLRQAALLSSYSQMQRNPCLFRASFLD